MNKYQEALNSLNPNYIGEQEYSWRRATEILQELVDKENNDITNKLSKLEDIEQELGIPLEVLFKALKDGIWCMTKEDGIEFMYRPKLFYNQDSYYFREDIFWFEAIIKTKDYGKTWSFVKEELE